MDASSSVRGAAHLADRVLGALRGSGGADLAEFVDSCADPTSGLGAVRLVGADVFLPHVVLDRPLSTQDAEVVAASLEVFPPVVAPVTPEQRVMAWCDWTTARALARLSGDAPVTTPEDPDAVLGPAEDWPKWSVAAAQLSSSAYPGATGPVVDAVAAHPLALCRGAVRTVLRRDFATAGRLARWVALLHAGGTPLPIDPVLLIGHIGLRVGAEPRRLLDLTVARHLVEAA
ncbi:hypothetical protein ABZ816_17785 [Actinosynnema sp. NPDC047251]|uniref:Uncharacterized protein n=1 Tax=Saccharothrix espanaensis (strain ATCC 51144 / DSM 44229 / JCM 9112 / NBRC 15066 / NRRL 15764) TaxID=1179773 RepID=K0K006_SACES|nr:hypothetical protein [Saccharothrix espanaensis]CCH30254.1 hypothetical protein BN6_29440 [Saccharothrix espanaensis DSM 44229]